MCLIVFSWDNHPKYKLVLAANRDEFYDRPSAPVHFWPDQPDVLGGKDLRAGGTWLAVNKKGWLGTVTNFRDPKNLKPDAWTRGDLPVHFLTESLAAEPFLQKLHLESYRYNGFNLLTLDSREMLHYSNTEGKINRISKGIHAISNALLDTPWPKVINARARLASALEGAFSHEELLEMMGDTQKASDAELPDTGVPPEWEKELSSMCIRTETYGTCCTTIVTLDREGNLLITEKSYPVGQRKEGIVQHAMKIKP